MRKLLFISSILFLLLSCRKELERPSWDVNLTGPLISSSLGLEDLIADSLLQVNADSSITLVYKSTIYSLDPASLFAVPDTILSDTFELPGAIPSIAVVPNQQIFSQTDDNSFYLDDVELTGLSLRSGKCVVEISSTVDQPTEYTYTLPGVTQNGIPFSKIIIVPAGSLSNPAIYSQQFDLSGYDFDLRGTSGSDYNAFRADLLIKMASTSSPTNLTNSDRIIISTGFTGLKPSYAKGYFGSQMIDVPSETVPFDLFNKLISGTIDIADIDINLILRNAIGADARITINQFLAQKTYTSASIALSHAVIGNPLNINRATSNGTGPVPSGYYIQLDENNSNIDQVIELLPDRITVAMDMHINPLGNVSAHNDFIYDVKTFDADLEITLPLNLIATNLTLADTVELQVEKGENGFVKEGVFRIYAENGFPLGADLQLFLLDEYNNPIDSLVAEGTIAAAPLTSSLTAVSKQTSVVEVKLSSAQMEQLYANARLLMKVIFYTGTQTQHIKIYDHYRLDLKTTGNFNYHIGPAQ